MNVRRGGGRGGRQFTEGWSEDERKGRRNEGSTGGRRGRKAGVRSEREGREGR